MRARAVAGIVVVCGTAAVVVCSWGSAFAQTQASGAQPDHFLLFSGFDVWRNGGFLHGGVLWSPDGLDREGFTFKLFSGGGMYRYRSGATEIVGTQEITAAMPGWRFKDDGLEVTVFAGADLQHHHFRPADPGNSLSGVHAGARGGFDLWYQPNEMLMATASVSA